jgi:mannose-6-phosphate isomerase-like protein (cupin superfamily)
MIAERHELMQFTMRGIPLVEQGQTMEPLAVAEHLWLHAKVYQGGGENGLHMHATEDHAFIVVSGRATFFDGDARSWEVGAFDGVMVPKGTLYRFEAAEDENLVMIRVGASPHARSKNGGYPAANDRRGPNGEQLAGDSPENGTSFRPTILSDKVFSPTG